MAIGASARSRTIPWPLLDARETGELARIESERHPVAIVFGREDRGLTNEELHLCQYHVSIPSDEEYGVLNVASAVQVIAYEVRMAHLLAEKGVVNDRAMPISHAPWDEDLVPTVKWNSFLVILKLHWWILDFLILRIPDKCLHGSDGCLAVCG